MTKNNALAIAILALVLSTQPVTATNTSLTAEGVSQKYVVADAAHFRQLSAAALDHTDIL